LLAFGGHLAETLLAMMRMNFSLTRDIIVDERAMGAFLLASGKMASGVRSRY
jgi:flagellar biosynthetic protein FlhB